MALSHAILVALLDQPRSGYDLTKWFDSSVGFFWKATHQQVYRELNRMEADHWIQAEVVRQDTRPDKKVFSLTPEGKAYLQSWIRIPVDVSPIRDELLVKLFAGYLVDPSELLTELKRHQEHHQCRLQRLKNIQHSYFQAPLTTLEKRYQHFTLQFGIQYEEDWLKWCQQVMIELGGD